MWNSLRFRIALLVLASLATVSVSLFVIITVNDAPSQGIPLGRIAAFSVLSLVGILALGFSYLNVRQFVVPLRLLTEMVDRIARGDYHAAGKPIGGAREIEQLRLTLDHMTEEVRAGQEAQQFYITQLTNAQEAERQRLARELHDDTIQSLVDLGQQADNLKELVGSNHPAAAIVDRIRQSAWENTDSLRQLASRLRPPYLEELGLVVALRQLAQESGAIFQLHGEERSLGGDRDMALYRIVQQALRNASQHARAQHIGVRVSFLFHEMNVTVTDDGKGFDVPADLTRFARAKHLGLMGMQERAHLLRGSVQIKSERGRGTEVTVRVPVL